MEAEASVGSSLSNSSHCSLFTFALEGLGSVLERKVVNPVEAKKIVSGVNGYKWDVHGTPLPV